MEIIIKNLDKEEAEAIKAMIAIRPDNTTIEFSNYLGELRFMGLEVEVKEAE